MFKNLKSRFKHIRDYYQLKSQGFAGILLKSGGKEEAKSRGLFFEENKEQIIADIHILLEDSINNAQKDESEEYKKGMRVFGDIYLDFLSECHRFLISEREPNLLEESKKKIEKEIIEKTQGAYTST